MAGSKQLGLVIAGGIALVAMWGADRLLHGRSKPLPPPAPAAQAPVEFSAPAPVDPLPRGAWHDPSVDPALLRKAYAPLSRPLPASAWPKPSPIDPPQSQAQRLKRQVTQGQLQIE